MTALNRFQTDGTKKGFHWWYEKGSTVMALKRFFDDGAKKVP